MDTSMPISAAYRDAKYAKKLPAGPPPIIAILEPFLRNKSLLLILNMSF
jgi:hypothetical protein